MTKEEILRTFSDIDYAYNSCSKFDTLKRMIDELTDTHIAALEEIEREVYQKDYYLYVDDIVENIRQIIRKLRCQK